MRPVGWEIRATDAIDEEQLARLPADVRGLVKRAAWRMDVALVGGAGEEPGTIAARIALTPNTAARELQRRAEAARKR